MSSLSEKETNRQSAIHGTLVTGESVWNVILICLFRIDLDRTEPSTHPKSDAKGMFIYLLCTQQQQQLVYINYYSTNIHYIYIITHRD